MTGRWFITPHAVRQAMRRVYSGMSYEQVLGQLIQASGRAHYVKDLPTGAQLWRTGKPERLRLIVNTREHGLPQLVTVLNGSDKGRQRHAAT